MILKNLEKAFSPKINFIKLNMSAPIIKPSKMKTKNINRLNI